MATTQPNIEEISLESIDQCSDIPTLSDTFGKLVMNENAKREEDRAAKKKERAAKEDALRRMRITEDEKKELANPNSEKEWVRKHQAAERRLLESGVTKETLDSDSLVAYYNSILDSGDPFLAQGRQRKLPRLQLRRKGSRLTEPILKRVIS